MRDTREYDIVKDYTDAFFEGLYTDDELEQVTAILYDSMTSHIEEAMRLANLLEREVN